MSSQLYSLTGYLISNGTLKLGKTNKFWFAYNETTCALESYLNENVFILNKNLILNQIDISKSAIIPESETNFQFSILSNSKRYILKAENLESYQIWIKELQVAIFLIILNKILKN